MRSTSLGAQRLSATSTILARLIRSRSGNSLTHGTKNPKVCNDDVGVRRFRVGRFGARAGPRASRARSLPRVSLVPRGFLGPRLGLQLGRGRLPRRLSPRYRRRQPRPRLARGPTWRPGAVAAWRPGTGPTWRPGAGTAVVAGAALALAAGSRRPRRLKSIGPSALVGTRFRSCVDRHHRALLRGGRFGDPGGDGRRSRRLSALGRPVGSTRSATTNWDRRKRLVRNPFAWQGCPGANSKAGV